MAIVLKLQQDNSNLEDILETALLTLRTGGLLIYPNDTVYGIGGDATNPDVVEKVLHAKKIKITAETGSRPVSVMFGDFSDIEKYCDFGLAEIPLMQKNLPGPYTFIMRMKTNVALPVATEGKLGVRMPDNPFCIALAQRFGKPIITTSANITKQKAPISFDEIDEEILNSKEVTLAIDGGKTKYGTPSQIVDLMTNEIKREGTDKAIRVKL